MSDEWWSKELPDEWPSKVEGPSHSQSSVFETTSSDVDVSTHNASQQAATVAIQQRGDVEPQWKAALSPKKGNVDHLVQMFRPKTPTPAHSMRTGVENMDQSDGSMQPPLRPNSRSQTSRKRGSAMSDASYTSHKSRESVKNGVHNTTTTSLTLDTVPQPGTGITMTTDSTFSDRSFTGEQPRRLKVYGTPNTFTNQRYDNLLTSLQGPGHTSNTVSTAPQSSIGTATSGNTSTGLAARMRKDGEQLLTRIRKASMPALPKLNSAPDTSLDELERNLTAQNHVSITSSNGSTLSTLNSSTVPKRAHKVNSSPALPRMSASRSSIAELRKFQDSSTSWSANDFNQSADDSHSLPGNTTALPESPCTPRVPRQYPSSQAHSSTATTLAGQDSVKNKANQQESARGHYQVNAGSQRPQRRPRPAASVHFHPAVGLFSDSPKSEKSLKEPLDSQIRDLGIPSMSSTTSSTDDSSHDLETRPSIVDVEKQSGNHAMPSTTESGEDSKIHSMIDQTHNNSVRFDQTHDNSVRFDQTHDNSVRFDQTQDNSVRGVFEPSMRDDVTLYNITAPHIRAPQRPASAPLPSSQPQAQDQSRLSVDAVDATYSASLYRLAELLSDKDNLEAVEYLDFSDKGLECLKGLDEMVPNVSILNLSRNLVKVVEGIPPGVLKLNLSCNSLDRLTTFSLSFITVLDLSHNQLVDLKGLSALRVLTDLDASNNNLTSLNGLRELVSLETLNVSHNLLTEINIEHATLTHLNASNNDIQGVRLSTPNLETLAVQNNKIVAMRPVCSLKSLNIAHNEATLNFDGWDNLENLIYDFNPAARNLGHLQLRTLSWQGQNVTGLQDLALRTVLALSLSSFEENLASIFTPETGPLPLEHLDIMGVGLRKLPAWLGEKFPVLSSLNVAFNDLDSDGLKALGRCPNLRRLCLYQNRISNIEGLCQVLKPLEHLGMLDLRENPVNQFCYAEPMHSTRYPLLAKYNQLFEINWAQTDKRWLQSAGLEAQHARARYRDSLRCLSLWWLDGIEISFASRHQVGNYMSPHEFRNAFVSVRPSQIVEGSRQSTQNKGSTPRKTPMKVSPSPCHIGVGHLSAGKLSTPVRAPESRDPSFLRDTKDDYLLRVEATARLLVRLCDIGYTNVH